MADTYQPRILDRVIKDLLGDFPAIMITGPRASGKTTTAARFARTTIRLDRPQEAAIVAADPDAAIRDRVSPVLIDEWQEVATVLGALKRSVDRDASPGQFLVTGSVRSDLDATMWPGTGRLVRVPMFGITTRERQGASDGPGLIDKVASGGLHAIEQPYSTPDLRGYVTELLVGGFPQPALDLSPAGREIWFESYLDQVATRDATLIESGRDPERLRRFIDVLAINTAGIVEDKTLWLAGGITRPTAVAYERLLTGLSMVEVMPAWWTNRIKRLVRRPKRFLIDAALSAAAIRIDEEGIMRDGDILGRLLETFVVAQLRAELAGSQTKARLHHLRTEQGRHEIDVIAELPRQQIIAIEIKATSAPGRNDARHLAWLRDEVGDQFIAGLVLHTGARVFTLEDRIVAAPISVLWS